MRYFKYHYNDRSGRIWSLFTKLAEANQSPSEFGLSCDYAHTLDIVKAAMSGSISLDDDSIESFNLQAYEYKCNENDKIDRIHNTKKELYIVDNFSEKDETRKVGFGDISAATLGTHDKRLDEIVNNESFNENLERLLGIRTKVMVEYGIDIVQALSEALRGTIEAIENIRKISDNNEKIKDVIISLCSSADSGRLLNSLAASA